MNDETYSEHVKSHEMNSRTKTLQRNLIRSDDIYNKILQSFCSHRFIKGLVEDEDRIS